MNNENFNLKSVVDFFEENGFRIIEAREYAFDRFTSRREIKVKIERKGEEGPVLTCRSAVNFMEKNGFHVVHVRAWTDEIVELTMVLYLASQAPSTPDGDQAGQCRQ